MQEIINPKPKIHLLDQLTANQIAAGEVVERPASVVKELVENAVDAGATQISVRIMDADCLKIQVADNGSGMVLADMKIAFSRHATSKITAINDLDKLNTLGFRGEALAAIAACSKIHIASKVAGNISGYQMDVEAGEMGKAEEVGMADGTIITVKDLFFNTPARKKFLRTSSRETGQISNLVSRIAMSKPSIAFRLYQGDKNILSTSGSGDLAEAIHAVYGKDVLQHMVSLQWMTGMIIYGMISLPELNRSNRNHYTFFVNGRWIKSREISQMVDNAYHTLLPSGRMPLVVLFLEIPPEKIDVNVHPSKMEIKLKDPETVSNCLIAAIKETFVKKDNLAPHLNIRNKHNPAVDVAGIAEEGIVIEEKPKQISNRLILNQPPQTGSLSRALYGRGEMTEDSYFGDVGRDDPGAPQGFDDVGAIHESPGRIMMRPYNLDESNTDAIYEPEISSEETEHGKLIFSMLRVLGQVDGTYIAALGSDSVYFIDQHAAHERILYEKIATQAAEESAVSNRLAIPETVEFTHQEALWLIDAIVVLNDLGFIIEHFGDNTFIIRGVPDWYEENNPAGLLRNIIEDMLTNRLDIVDIREEQLFMMSCKKAVKANKYLTPTDILALFNDLDHCANPATCPHGRPIAIKLTYKEIRQRFLRSTV